MAVALELISLDQEKLVTLRPWVVAPEPAAAKELLSDFDNRIYLQYGPDVLTHARTIEYNSAVIDALVRQRFENSRR